MKRDKFDTLEVIEQIKYINKRLLEGFTLTNLCKDIGIGRSTIRDRFKRVGYEYNKSNNQYESIIEIVDLDSMKLESSKKVVETEKRDSSNLVIGTNDKVLTHMINNYDDNLKKLNEMYEWYKLESSKKVVATESLKIDDFKGDIVVRSYKLYETIQKDFTDFCKANNKYKVQDILSQAIKEFLEKYN